MVGYGELVYKAIIVFFGSSWVKGDLIEALSGESRPPKVPFELFPLAESVTGRDSLFLVILEKELQREPT